MKSDSKRIVARILSFVMIVSCMFANLIVANADPADLLSDDVASGSAVTTYTFDATDLSAAADKEVLAQSEVDSYFTVTGTIQKRLSSGAVSSVELGKNETGSISFTIANDNSSVAFDVSSTGTNNTSSYALVDSTGTAVKEGDVTGSSAGRTTITADGLAAGTYTITSPDKGYKRGTRLYSIIVADGGQIETTEATTEATTEEATTVETTTEVTTVEATTEATTVEDTTTEVTTEGNNGGNPNPGVVENFQFWLDDVAEDVAAEDGTTSKVVKSGEYYFGGSTVKLVPGHNGENYTQSYANAIGVTRDDKVVNGYKAGSRPTECNNFTALPATGSSMIAEVPATGTLTVYFVSTSFLRITDFVDGANVGMYDSAVAADSFSIKAEPGHQYIISTTGKTNNMAFCGVQYIVDEDITVPVTFNNPKGLNIDTLEVSLTDVALGTVAGTVKADTTSVVLAKNHTYKLTSNDGGISALVSGNETFKADSDAAVTIDLDEIPDVTLTGKITGADASVVTKIAFTNTVNGAVSEFNASEVVSGDTYTVVLKPGTYNTSVVTTNGYITKDRVNVVAGTENSNEIYLESEFNGTYYLPVELARTSDLTFNGSMAVNNSTSIKAVAGDSIVIPVKGTQVITVAGWYAGTWNINGQNEVTADSSSSAATPVTNTYTTNGTETEVTVNVTGAGANYLYWIKVEDVVAFNNNISVPGDYPTLRAAVDAIKAMDRPDGEDGRVTINLTADVQEQINFDAPYITLNGNGHQISWYYGVGTFYYSIDSNGYYNETLFRDKFTSNEGNGSLWGGVAIISGNNFIAENTTFKNTYNYEIVDKELEDIAYSVTGMPTRTATSDVSEYAYKERSNAFYINADNIEVYNCNILSSQDTLGRNGSTNYNFHTYFKDCTIGGNVDYICGEFTAIFDNCELQWKTYDNDGSGNNNKIGYIVAPKTSPYIFRNCEITTDKDVFGGVQGLFGRTWGADSNATFANCETNGTIKADGWGEMSNGDFATAKFAEYKNVDKGIAFESTGSYAGTQVAEENAGILTDTPDSVATIETLGGWTPVHYEFKATEWTTEATTESTTEGTTLDPSGKVDLTKGLVAGNNDDVLRGLEAGENMPANVEIIGDAEVPFVAGSNNPHVNGTGIAGGDITETNAPVPTGGAYIAYTAKVDGTLYLNVKVNSGKKLIFVNEDTTLARETYVNDTADSQYPDFDLHLTAGQKVYVYCQGSKPRFFDIEFVSDNKATETTTEVTTVETSTEATTVETTTETTTTGGSDVPTETTTTAPATLWGDVDGNGIVEAKDAADVIQYVINSTNSNINVAVADVNADGIIDSVDATMILQKSLDSTYKLPVEPAEDTTEATTEGTTEELANVKVFVVGDSTACHYINTKDDAAYVEGTELNDPNFWYKRVGFGDKIGNYLNDKVEVVNLALSGRSSKSFATGINENGKTDEAAVENYNRLKNEIGAGDYLVIAWGHNDEKSDSYRHTDPTGDKDTAGSFKNSLYENYIKLAQDKGATPILCTPIIRANKQSLSNNDVHNTDAYGDYAQPIRDLGAELGVTVIDNLENTKALYTELQNEIEPNRSGARVATGPTKDADGNPVDPTGYFKMQAADQGLGVDTTHLNNFGASMVAYMFAQSLAATDNTLAKYVVAADKPVFNHADCYNPDWVAFDESVYNPSTIWKTSAPWAGSAFGSGIGTINEDAHDPFDITESTDGSVTLNVANNKGKVASSEDGIVMYFQEIEANQDFTLTATAHVNRYTANNNQSAFGLMLRDNMFTDYTYKTNAAYYAVGNTTQNSGKALIPSWRRTSGANGEKNLRTNEVTCDVEATADTYTGKDVQLTISRTNGVVTVTYASDVANGTYTYPADGSYIYTDPTTGEQTTYYTDLTATKADKDYVGMFVARDANVTFSNISLTK